MSDAEQGRVGTWRHTEVSATGLLAAKTASGLRVSVVIPAKDEQATVGDVVARLKADWVDGSPLVDELVVMDSDSTDRTGEVARTAGASVYRTRDVRPDLGPGRGKGEALWKSLFVTTGDLLVFVDADLLEWGTHFVPGLLAPLLTTPGTQLVKAVYDRPMLDDQGREEERGGRVTELVARPLLALGAPALAGLVQPLAGEWAVRRAAFETYAVPRGYGVEIAAVLDTWRRYGVAGLAQVDLGRRAHRHHRHDTLGLMAVQVMAASLPRLGTGDPHPDGIPMTQWDPGVDGFTPRVTDVDVSERPPARDVATDGRRLT